MATKEKEVNYTVEVTAKLVAGYEAGRSVKELAAEFGKSERSVIAKLTREGVYVSKEKAKGATRETKAALVARIAAATGVAEETLDSLEKATHAALEAVVKALEARTE
jgi:hypothetical protein